MDRGVLRPACADALCVPAAMLCNQVSQAPGAAVSEPLVKALEDAMLAANAALHERDRYKIDSTDFRSWAEAVPVARIREVVNSISDGKPCPSHALATIVRWLSTVTD